MGFTKDRKTGFSNEGFRIRRVNPDGTYPAVDNHLGFTGTVDASALGATDVLSYRWDGVGAFADIVCNLTAVGADPTAATPLEIATALNLIAGFSAQFIASVDSTTSRLLIENAVAVTGKTYLELKGDIAIGLGFGASGDASAMGTQFVECYDDSAAIALPKNWKDGEEIEQESGSGNIDSMLIDGVLKGVNPSIALTDEMYELKQMLMGGLWDDTLTEYTPPTSELVVAPLCAAEIFVAKYGKGSQHRGDMTGYKMYKIPRMTGHETDLSHEVKGWAAYQFECMASEYMEGTVRKPGYTEKELTIAQATTLGIV